MKKINLNSFRAKLIISMFLVVFIPIATISIIIDVQIKNQLKNDAINSTLNEIRQVDTSINIFMEGIKENVHMMSQNQLVRKVDNTVRNYLDNPSDDTKMTPSKNGGIESQIYNEFVHVANSHPKYAYVYMGD